MGYNDNGAENGFKYIYEAEVCTQKLEWSRGWGGVLFYDCVRGVGSGGGNEMGLYLSWTKRAFLLLQISSDQ